MDDRGDVEQAASNLVDTWFQANGVNEWIPFQDQALRIANGKVTYLGWQYINGERCKDMDKVASVYDAVAGCVRLGTELRTVSLLVPPGEDVIEAFRVCGTLVNIDDVVVVGAA